MKTRLLIADDHRMMREGLRALIDGETDMLVVGEAETGRQAVEMAQQGGPHVVVMDVAMPDLNGIEATRQIKRDNASTRIIALSGHADQHLVVEMLRAGASGYVLKHTAYEDLVRAIHEVMQGRSYLSPEVTKGLVDMNLNGLPNPGEHPAFTLLSDREREVLQLLAEGASTKKTAAALGMGVKTAETHRRNIMEKLDLHSVAELTRYAIREGIAPLDS